MKRAFWSLVIATPLVILLASGFGRDPNAHASTLINKSAPAFALTSLDGRRVSLASLRGHPIVLNFWASWCRPCIDEHPYLLNAWHVYGPRGARFVGIQFSDTASNARWFMRHYGGGWPVLQDPGQSTAVNYGVAGPPETFFIDAAGVVRYKVTGPLTLSLMNRQIEPLLRRHR